MKRFRYLVFALVALVVSALNPPGYMASVGAEGISISICSGRGVDRAVIAPDNPLYETYAAIYGESDEGSHGAEDEMRDGCAFSAGDTSALTPTDVTALQSSGTAASQGQSLSALSVRTPRASPPSTGPPSNF